MSVNSGSGTKSDKFDCRIKKKVAEFECLIILAEKIKYAIKSRGK